MRLVRRLLVVLAIAAVHALLMPALGAAAGAPHCSNAQLRLKFVDFQGATGHRFWDLAFKNVGARKCTLHGYPRVTLLDSHGARIRAKFARVTRVPVKTVMIKPGKRAFFSIEYADGAFCARHFFASRIEIFAPGNAGGFVFNPEPANHGPIFVCKSSEEKWPVRSKLAM
jgi:hypothetical protein